MARPLNPDGPRPDRTASENVPAQRPLERRQERAERRDENHDDITDVAPTHESERMGDVARNLGDYVGDVLDGMAGAAGGSLDAVGRTIAGAGEGIQRIGQVIAGGGNPWQSESSSGGGDECEDDGADNGGSDENGGGGETSDDPEFEFDLNVHIQWSTAADASTGPVLQPLDDGGVVGHDGESSGFGSGGDGVPGGGPAALDGGQDDILLG